MCIKLATMKKDTNKKVRGKLYKIMHIYKKVRCDINCSFNKIIRYQIKL